MERWQRRVLVTLGTLVVIMAALAVGLVIRNALGSSGLVEQSTTSSQTDAGDTTLTTASDPGDAETTATLPPPTTIPAPTTTATSVPPLPPPPASFVEETIGASALRLQPEGLGPIPFGTGVDRTLAVLTGALGSPATDTGWLPADVERLRCPGARARRVAWGSLSVLFSDGPTDWGPDLREHFFSFVYSLSEGAASPDGPSLRTSEGLRLGDTLARSASIYGESAITRGDPTRGTFLEVEVPGPGNLLGVFAGPADEDLLVSLTGGQGCRPETPETEGAES